MKDTLTTAITNALTALGAPEVNFVVEPPNDRAHGDYASNAALVAAKTLGQSPRAVAEALKNALDGTLPSVANITIAGPGFLNFTLTRTYFSELIETINQTPETWGNHPAWKHKTVVVEYTDANPFKEFHVGHLFTNAVGESIARLFMMAGANVKRVNYQGDVGLHVAHAVYGMRELGIDPHGEFSARDLGRAYALGATAYKTDETAQNAIRTINQHIYARDDKTINTLYDAGRRVSLAYFETIYQVVDTKFDDYFFESETGPRGKTLVLEHPEIFPESDGARVFHGEDYGLHTRVFLNKEGLPTYEAKELALAKVKEERLGHYDHSVIATSNEVTEYFKVLKAAMARIYPDLATKTEHVGHGTVRLSTGKMSSRTGDVIAAIDFINDVADAALEKMTTTGVTTPDQNLATTIATGAIKYATLRGNVAQDSVFDKDKALSFEGDSGPYLQYTYARIQSVIRKAESLSLTPDLTALPETAYAPERLLPIFPEVLATALSERSPHKVVTYLTELAGAFNSFYAHEKIADTTDPHAPYKLTIAVAVAHTLKQGLWVLGITAPERM